MNCPTCNHEGNEVIDSRAGQAGEGALSQMIPMFNQPSTSAIPMPVGVKQEGVGAIPTAWDLFRQPGCDPNGLCDSEA